MAEFKGLWAIVKVAGGQYIGALHGLESAATGGGKHAVLNQIDKESRVFMKPAYEFNMLMNQTPEGIKRMPLAVPIGVCMSEVGTYLWPSQITFFDDMEEEDRNQHKKVVEAALVDITKSRAVAAGIELPPGPGPGRFG